MLDMILYTPLLRIHLAEVRGQKNTIFILLLFNTTSRKRNHMNPFSFVFTISFLYVENFHVDKSLSKNHLVDLVDLSRSNDIMYNCCCVFRRRIINV